MKISALKGNGQLKVLSVASWAQHQRSGLQGQIVLILGLEPSILHTITYAHEVSFSLSLAVCVCVGVIVCRPEDNFSVLVLSMDLVDLDVDLGAWTVVLRLGSTCFTG